MAALASQAVGQVANQNIKPTANQKGKKADKKNKKAERKKKGAFFGAFMMFLFILLLLAAGGALVYFNLFDAKTIVVDFISQGVSPYTEIEAYIIERQQGFDGQQLAINDQVKLYNDRVTELSAREQAAADREAMAQQEYDDAQYYRQQLETTTLEVERVAEIFNSLDPASAGAIMAEMGEIKYMIRILKAMEPRRASRLMENIDPRLGGLISKEFVVE